MKKVLIIFCISLISCGKKKFAVAISKEISFYHLEKVDTLVDIGCGQAVFSKSIAHKYTNLFQILEDLLQLSKHSSEDSTKDEKIDTRTEVKKWLKKSSYLPKIDSKYQLIIGTEDSIPIASASCKRVICRRTLHEFRNKKKMISELERILAIDGMLTIAEVEPKYLGDTDPYCKNKYLSKQDVMESFKKLRLNNDTFVYYRSRKMNIYNFIK